MPAEDGVRIAQRPELLQQLAPDRLALGRQAALLLIGQQKSLAANVLTQDSVLLLEILDDLLLPAVHPSRNGYEEESPWCPGHGTEDTSSRWLPQG